MWSFETRTLQEGDTGPGLVNTRYLPIIFIALGLLSGVLVITHLSGFWPSLILLTASLLLARQFALDLCHETLLDIYNLPLAILGITWASIFGVGLTHSLMGGFLGLAFSSGAAWVLGRIKPGTSGLGGGDIKLLTLMGLWLGPLGLFLAFFVGTLLNLLVALMFNRSSLPQGPGFIAALWVMLVYPGLLINLFLQYLAYIS